MTELTQSIQKLVQSKWEAGFINGLLLGTGLTAAWFLMVLWLLEII